MEETCRDFGPAVNMLRMLEPTARERLSNAIKSLFEQKNKADDGSILVPAEYLQVIVRRR
jgi:hypothetical protein